MDRELREEREFSEHVDRLLAGEKGTVDEGESEEYRRAFSFARKIIRLRRQPSPRFKAELRKQLLLKLEERQEEQEERSKITLWEVFRSLVPKTPVWRGATVTVAVGVLAVLVIWGAGLFSQTPGTVTGPESTAMLGVPSTARLQLETSPSDALAHPAGEAFQVDIIFKNISADSITIDPYPPVIEIQEADTSDVVRSFAQGTDKREIAPSEGLIYMLVWDQKDDSGQQVDSGRYNVVISDVEVLKNAQAEDAFGGARPLVELVIQ
ncbi:MAG: hypothetical protein FJ004_08690 [Chloroflexi bacterium]|nr:hypothetical protein [Chloroflexota bacterium]